MATGNKVLLKVELGIKFFINFSKSNKNNFYQYHYIVFLIYIFTKYWNMLKKKDLSHIKIKIKKRKKKSHDTMFLKSAFKHKVPKHIFIKNQSFLFFSAELTGHHAMLTIEKPQEVGNVFPIGTKNSLVSLFSKMPGCQITFVKYSWCVEIDDLIFLPK